MVERERERPTNTLKRHSPQKTDQTEYNKGARKKLQCNVFSAILRAAIMFFTTSSPLVGLGSILPYAMSHTDLLTWSETIQPGQRPNTTMAKQANRQQSHRRLKRTSSMQLNTYCLMYELQHSCSTNIMLHHNADVSRHVQFDAQVTGSSLIFAF